MPASAAITGLAQPAKQTSGACAGWGHTPPPSGEGHSLHGSLPIHRDPVLTLSPASCEYLEKMLINSFY